MTDLECEFCNNKFLNKYNLEKHQKTAKFCLKIQNKNIDEVELNIACEYCNKKFLRKHHYNTHIENCKIKKNSDDINKDDEIDKLKQSIKKFKNIIDKKDNVISVLENKIKDLENRNKLFKELYEDEKIKNTKLEETIEKLSIKAIENAGNKTFNTTTTNKNKIVNALIPLTNEYMLEQTKYLNIDHVKHGTQSLALFAKDYTFKDRIAITDASRNKFVFKDENGNLINDPNGVKITDKFIEINKDVLIDVLTQYMEILKTKISKAYEEFDTVLISKYEGELIQANSNLQTIKNQDEPSNIKSFDKLKGDFIKYLSSMLDTV